MVGIEADAASGESGIRIGRAEFILAKEMGTWNREIRELARIGGSFPQAAQSDVHTTLTQKIHRE